VRLTLVLLFSLLLVNPTPASPAPSAEPTSAPLALTQPDLVRAGEAFLDFARGGAPDQHLLRHPVDLYLGGRLVHTIPGWRAVHRNSYGYLCPTSRSYAAYTCPFSPVRALLRHRGPITVTTRASEHPCVHDRTFAGWRSHTVTLAPTGTTSCLDYFVVELAVSDDGRLEAVNLLAAEP
jgi:hypothetical protein